MAISSKSMAATEWFAGWQLWRLPLLSEVAQRADFSRIRYAQCWEDADVLLEALDIQPGSTCLSIASAGDNALAMLSKGPRKVIAVDISPAQLVVLELRVAAFRELRHPEVLALVGSVGSHNRIELYRRCRKHLSTTARNYWDRRPEMIEGGIGSAGRFENFFHIFRTRVLPLIHNRRVAEQLLARKSRSERTRFYETEWNTIRWRTLFRVFFSRLVLGRLGRDPEFFRYVEGDVAERILQRVRYALTELDPAANPYLQWIFTGQHSNDSLPFSLRPENFEAIRAHLDHLEWRCCSLEQFLESSHDAFDAFNLSDVFEYISWQNYERLLRLLIQAGKPGARLAYWNMLVPRSRPESLASFLKPLTRLSDSLFQRDKAFFYDAFVLEEVL
jgi:S-adenosylmethionine-diacylglycerol 3-amino-3-carboxypropyl transferase